ncbi:MAG TPA: 3-phosphoshikimate 1-carboxyvinyltransferase [Candidatus Polarisedimenticolia bacterium]|nr:3-phosphoshikimate 1-carboxyvinyltransferase [Candidatus Polarisedimenticolia bacterium]
MARRARAIHPGGPVDAKLIAPPSKSVTQRALILSALASGVSTLISPLESNDTKVMIEALSTLGFTVHRREGAWDLQGGAGKIPCSGARIDSGDAGTAARFLTALVCLGRGRFVVDGSKRMRERTIQPLVDALRRLGVEVRYLGNRGCPPLEILAEGLKGGTTRVRGDLGSQFLSALLLVAPRASSPLRIEPEGPVASLPYLELTAQVMQDFGVAPHRESPLAFEVKAPHDFAGREFRIEGDYSSAGYFFAAAAITGGRVKVDNLRLDSAQADRGILEALEEMGCRVESHGTGWTLTGGPLDPLDRDLSGMPDAAPTLAVTALFARGKSVLKGLATLRIKESDRIAALARELSKLGAVVEEGRDSLEIHPRPLRGAPIHTYQDHRMAMSFALAGLRIPGTSIQDPDCVSKSFPGFWSEFARLELRS